VQRIGQIVRTEVARRNTLPRQLRHPWALVEADHRCAAGRQLLGVQTGTACRVQHGASRHVAEKPKTGRAVIVGVVETVPCVVEELVGEYVVLGIRTHGIRHAASPIHAHRSAAEVTEPQ
jgi:hypothetical protein